MCTYSGQLEESSNVNGFSYLPPVPLYHTSEFACIFINHALFFLSHPSHTKFTLAMPSIAQHI